MHRKSPLPSLLQNMGRPIILLGRSIKKTEAVYDHIEKTKVTPQAAIVPLILDGAAGTDYIELANTIEKWLVTLGRHPPPMPAY